MHSLESGGARRVPQRRGLVRFVVALRWLSLLVGLAALASCLGDVSIDHVSFDAGIEVVPLEPPCIPGEVECSGSWVQRCVPSGTDAPPRWSKIEDCLSESLCQAPGVCNRPVCKPREVRCFGAIPQRCRADLTGWDDLGECETAAHCSLDEGKCSELSSDAPCCLEAPCEPGELRCNSADIQRCRADQTDLDLVTTCATPALCTASLDACAANPDECACEAAACEANETRCVGSELQRCNRDRTGFEFVEACDSAPLCELGRARSPLSCQPAACGAGTYNCTSTGALEACKADRTGYDPRGTCPGGVAFCNSGLGQCTDTPCDPGERTCGGAQVLACRSDQTDFEPTGESCETAELCRNDGNGGVTCLPPACPANDVRCAGSQLQRCNAGRTDYANVGPTCLRDDLCSAARQRCDFCFPSRRECTPDLRSSRTCAGDGNSFGPSTFCPLGCIANTGACQTCNVGSYACQGGFLSRCNDGFSFSPLNRGADCSGATRVTCNGNTVQNTPCGGLGCNTTRNACNECSGQTRTCDGADAFRTCRNDGTFGPSTDCQDGLVCTGQGQCVCTPNAASCDDDDLLVCNSSGTAIVPGERCSGGGDNVLRTCNNGVLTTNTCGSSALCDAATGAACPVCLDGERTCSTQSGQPLDCVDGQRVPQTPCGDGLVCEGAGLCRCAAQSLVCDGNALLVCNAGRTGFDPADVCDGATLRVCTNGAFNQIICADEDACQASVDGTCDQ